MTRQWLLAVVIALVCLLEPSLLLFAVLGLLVSYGVTRLRRKKTGTLGLRQPRKRRIGLRILTAVLLLAVAAAFFATFLGGESGEDPYPVVPITIAVRYTAETTLRPDGGLWSITDRFRIDQTSAQVMLKVLGAGSAREQEIEAVIERASRILLTRFKDAGWRIEDLGVDEFTLSRARSLEAGVPLWPLASVQTISVVRLDSYSGGRSIAFEPADGSSMRIDAPRRMIISTFPSSSSRDDMLDGAERTVVPIARSDEEVRLRIASRLARNTVMASLLTVSAWDGLKWIILIVAGVFREYLTNLIQRATRRMFRLRKPAASKQPA